MIRPVDAPISQRFGDNPTKDLPWNSWLIQTFGNYQPDGHSGEDYACAAGTPIRAVAAGTVLHVGWMGGTYADNPWWIAPNFAGYCAVIDHGSFIAIYGHCQDGSAKVKAGQSVAEGQVFILSGNTGGSTGPHLHFEILPDRYVLGSRFYGRIDPAPLFANTITPQGTITPLEDDEMTPDQFNNLVAKLDELNAAHHVTTREHVNGTTAKVLDREPLLIHRLDELNSAHHVATREHVNGVRDALLANFRATIDLLKPTAEVGAVEAAEKIYAEVLEKLSNLSVTVTAGGK